MSKRREAAPARGRLVSGQPASQWRWSPVSQAHAFAPAESFHEHHRTGLWLLAQVPYRCPCRRRVHLQVTQALSRCRSSFLLPTARTPSVELYGPKMVRRCSRSRPRARARPPAGTPTRLSKVVLDPRAGQCQNPAWASPARPRACLACSQATAQGTRIFSLPRSRPATRTPTGIHAADHLLACCAL